MQTRNNSIDILKLILTIMLASGHILPYTFETEVQTFFLYVYHGLARLIVPLFFIMSGYFVKNKLNDFTKTKFAFFRFYKLFIIWQLIYFPLFYRFYKNDSINTKTFFLDLFYGFAHIWYLFALSFGILLVYAVRNKSFKFKLILAVSLIIIGFTLQTLLELHLFNKTSINIYLFIGTSRNVLFFGFPYLLLGTIIEEIKLPKIKFFILLLSICMVAEAFFYKENKINLSNIFIFGLPLSIYIFKYTLVTQSKFNIKVNPKLLLGTYLIHFYAIYYVTINYPSVTFEATLMKIALVLISTFTMFYILNIIDKKLKILF